MMSLCRLHTIPHPYVLRHSVTLIVLYCTITTIYTHRVSVLKVGYLTTEAVKNENFNCKYTPGGCGFHSSK